MHVLHIYKDYLPVLGGIEQHLALLAPRQVARGLRVTVLVAARPGQPTSRSIENGVEVIRLRRWGTLASTPLTTGLGHAVRRLRPDVTHVHAPFPPGELASYLWGRQRPMIVYYHSDIVRQRWLKRAWLPLQQRVLRRANRVLTSSSAYAQSSPVLAPLGNHVAVLPIGIDTARFADGSAATMKAVAAVKRRFSGPIVLFVGRLRYYKGLDVLIDAIATVSATLLVVGRGPMERAWHQRAATSTAVERIHFLGDVTDDELTALDRAADVFVLPSTQRSEAFGLAQVEAMAASTPVVSTRLGTGTSVVNRDQETGLVVAPNDPDALAGALRVLIDDPILRARLGQAARARAVDAFGIDTMVDQLERIYRGLLPGR